MSAVPTSDLDPFSAEFRADPYSRYAELRALGPVVHLPGHDIWAVARYAEVRHVLTDYTVFSNAGGGGIRNYFKEKPWRRPSIILEVDPPDHERARTVLTRVMSAAALRKLRAGFEIEAGRLIDAALEKGRFDGVADLAQPYPLKVFPDAIGMASAERDKLLVYGAMVFGAFGPPTADYDALMEDAEAISAWVDARCSREALDPDAIGAAIYLSVESGEITEDEARLLVRSFLSAGVDTTIDSFGLTLRAFAENPAQWEALRDDPGLARAAFEEATRFDSSSQSLFRTTLVDTEIGGIRIGRHEKVMAFIGSANRDPGHWDEPDRFDIRRRTVGHLSFGAGIHGCVAQMMARIEGEAFLSALAHRVDAITLDGEPRLKLQVGLRGLTCLPMAMTPRRTAAAS